MEIYPTIRKTAHGFVPCLMIDKKAYEILGQGNIFSESTAKHTAMLTANNLANWLKGGCDGDLAVGYQKGRKLFRAVSEG